MLELLSRRFAKTLSKNDFSIEQQEICAYGIEMAIYTFISTAGLLLVGYFFGMVIQTAVLIAFYYTIQTVGGGYHAHSHFACYTIMLAGLLICIFIMKLPQIGLDLIIPAVILAGVYLILNPLHLHPHKSYLQSKYQRISYVSRIITIISTVLILLLILTRPTIGISAALGLVAAAISRFAGKKQ